MADWYVDFTLDTNGSGTTYSGAWNQFTATEAATVSGGDSIWFRRCDPGNGAKIITIKEGDSSGSIKYIGWPKEGDVLYDSRPVDPRDTWDSDGAEYVYQRLSTDNGPVHSLKSDNRFYRWCFYNYFNSNSSNRAVDIISENNVSVYHSYIHNYYYNSPYDYAKSLRIENSNNIYFKDTIIKGPSYNAYNFNQAFKFYKSTIIFDDCVFKTPSSFSSDSNSANNIKTVSYINYCTLHFNNCIFNSHVLCSNTGDTTDNNYCAMVYNSTIYFNNTKLEHNRTDSINSNIFSRSPYYLFYVNNCIIVLTSNCEYNSWCDMAAGFYVTGDSSIYCSDFQINTKTDSASQNIVFDLWNINNIVINNISGSVNYYKHVEDKNYFIGLNDSLSFEYFTDKITISGVTSYVGDVIEKLRYCQPNNQTITINNNTIFKDFDVYFGTPREININNSEIGGVGLYYRNYDTGCSYYGSKYVYKNFKITNSIIKKYRALYIPSSYVNPIVNAIVYNCEGLGSYSLFDDDSDSDSVVTLNLLRNKGFSSVGSLCCAKNKIYNSVFNRGELNTYKYCYAGHIENSNVCRTNGANYSIKVFKETVDDVLYISELGYETIWVRLPDSGTYTVASYMLYTCTSGTLSLSDIYFEMDSFDSSGFSFCTKSNSLDSDSSTWSVDGTKIKLSCSVTVSNAQFCPIRFYIPGNYDNLIIYIDPKLNVMAV